MSNTSHQAPPKLALWWLRLFCHPDLIEDVEGDLEELFTQHLSSSKWASWLYWVDVWLLFRPGIIRPIQLFKTQNNYSMFKNFTLIALRNALKYKQFTLLNLLGLIVGISASMLILLWAQDEQAMDRFHVNGDQIYQLHRNMQQSNGMISTTSSIPKPAGDLIKETYPEVEQVAALSWDMDAQFDKDESTSKNNGRYASTEFLKLFSFELLVGDVNTALDEINSIIISQEIAEVHFGDDWQSAVGQTIKASSAYNQEDYDMVVVTGIMANTPANSSLEFEWLRPAESFYTDNQWVDDWGNGSFGIYVSIPDEDQVQAVKDRVYQEINNHTQDNNLAGNETLIMHRFSDSYLYSQFDNGVVSGGRIDYLRILIGVAVFLLLVACINFMNLTTARANRRSKEIGLRKVMGAYRQAIRVQFFFEALLNSLIAVLISVGIVTIALPFFNQMVGKQISIDYLSVNFILFTGGVWMVTGVLSGLYPALLLPTFGVIESLKGGIKQRSFAINFRRGLVVVQFGVSMLLIIGTAAIYQQIQFVLNKDLGLNKDNLVAVTLYGDLSERLDTYKNELSAVPQIKNVTAMSGNPVNYGRSTSSANWEGKDPNEGYEVNVILTDDNFINTMEMEIIDGRGFESQLRDSTNFIINEVAAKLMGFDEPIGKKLSFWGIDGQIVGVVKDFHMRNMYEPIAPLIVTCINPSRSYVALIRINGNTQQALGEIEEITQKLNPAYDFEYAFVDQAYAEGYEQERTVSSLINIFAVIAIFLSCVGIYGLAAYSAEQRSREIGVRKVHGASVSNILLLLSNEYARLMLVSFVVAVPIAYYLINGWLDGFAYRTTLGAGLYMLSGLMVFVIGLVTVASKSYHSATTNPVNSLKEE